jgi:hypothetical protein
MSMFQTILVTVVGSATIGAALWFFVPFRNRLERVRSRIANDHGVTLRTYPTTEAVGGLRPEDMLGTQPSWLVDNDFYFRDGIPAGAPGDESEWAAWARKHGGEPVGWSHILIHVQATQDRTVLLRHPTANITRTNVAGGVVLSPFKELGGNGLMVRQFNVALDAEPVRVEYYPEGGHAIPQFTMTRGSTEAFLVIAHAVNGRYEWSLDIPVLVDGEEFTLRADDGGKPFVNVGAAGIKAKWWRFDMKEWQPAEW